MCLLKEVSEEGRQGLGTGWPRALPRLSQRLPPQRFPGTEVKPDWDESPQSRSAMTPQHLGQKEQAVSTSTTPFPSPSSHPLQPVRPGRSQPPGQPGPLV